VKKVAPKKAAPKKAAPKKAVKKAAVKNAAPKKKPAPKTAAKKAVKNAPAKKAAPKKVAKKVAKKAAKESRAAAKKQPAPYWMGRAFSAWQYYFAVALVWRPRTGTSQKSCSRESVYSSADFDGFPWKPAAAELPFPYPVVTANEFHQFPVRLHRGSLRRLFRRSARRSPVWFLRASDNLLILNSTGFSDSLQRCACR